ncbi:MAG TPA: hypothetical protein VLY23_11705 [Candidatus Acidoferrum sp.]|nr:hypothetical protein [Candidatus Acidoferrum sp.]
MRFTSLIAGMLLLASAVSAGAVSGTVRNGTTGKVAAGVDVILIQLQGGMQSVANTKTDSEGRYHFDNPGLGQAPMLIRAVYRGVNYHEPVPPGKATADVEVFEPTDKPDAFSVTAHAIVVQPSSNELSIGEIYNVTNQTQPPKAYFREDGSFVFSLPEGAQLGDVSAQGASGMPVTQGTIDKGKNEEAIAFPFRPGDSGVRISYKLPYAGNQARLRFVSPYAAERVAIFAPPGVQVSGEGLSAAGSDQGFSVYMRESVAANTPLNVSISGVGAPVPTGQGGAPGGDESQNPSANSRLDQGAPDATASATTMPARLDSLKWILVGGFVAIFALGFVYLWRRPQMVAAGPAVAAPTAAAPASLPRQSAAPAAAAPSAGVVEDVKRQVTGSLDEMKEKLFRLELRRQAGTISEAEYAVERQRIEQLLRDLVRG